MKQFLGTWEVNLNVNSDRFRPNCLNMHMEIIWCWTFMYCDMANCELRLLFILYPRSCAHVNMILLWYSARQTWKQNLHRRRNRKEKPKDKKPKKNQPQKTTGEKKNRFGEPSRRFPKPGENHPSVKATLRANGPAHIASLTVPNLSTAWRTVHQIGNSSPIAPRRRRGRKWTGPLAQTQSELRATMRHQQSQKRCYQKKKNPKKQSHLRWWLLVINVWHKSLRTDNINRFESFLEFVWTFLGNCEEFWSADFFWNPK